MEYHRNFTACSNRHNERDIACAYVWLADAWALWLCRTSGGTCRRQFHLKSNDCSNKTASIWMRHKPSSYKNAVFIFLRISRNESDVYVKTHENQKSSDYFGMSSVEILTEFSTEHNWIQFREFPSLLWIVCPLRFEWDNRLVILTVNRLCHSLSGRSPCSYIGSFSLLPPWSLSQLVHSHWFILFVRNVSTKNVTN